MKKVGVKPNRSYTRDYPNTLGCRIAVKLGLWRTLKCEKKDYEGFHGRPMSRAHVLDKFIRLGRKAASEEQLGRIAECVLNLDAVQTWDLRASLASVS